MTDHTVTWQERCDRLSIRVPTVASATGYTPRAVRSYREGTRRAPADFLAKVDEFLTAIELVVGGGRAA